jgi:uncharacterized repeat protein (TIGR02543 family)
MMNDGTVDPWDVKTVTPPVTVIGRANFPVEPSHPEYKFAGWNTQPDGKGTEFTASTTVSGSIIVYALWTRETYIVTFMMNDGFGTVYEERTVKFPATTLTDFPDDPVWLGYYFAEWNTEPGGGGSGFTAGITVDRDITVYAQWTDIPPNSHTVTFMMNNVFETIWAMIYVTFPETTIGTENFPADPYIWSSEYSFSGWNTDPNGGGSVFTAATPITDDITVYAQWTANPSYTVTFIIDGGLTYTTRTVIFPDTTIGTADFPADPSLWGYSFTEWNMDPGGGGTPFTDSTTVANNITVYAQWTANSYTVTFMMNDGTETIHAAKSVTYPTTTIDTGDFPANPSRNGYSFGGWYTEQNGGVNQFTAWTQVSADITVYAKWTANTYTVTFKAGYGAIWDWIMYTKTVTHPATTIGAEDFPADPYEPEYTFGGWYTEVDGLGSEFTATTPVSADITVYAKWTGNTHTVTFMRNDGTETVHTTKSVTYPATTVGTLPASPTRSGYTFGGWNTQADGLGTAFIGSTPVTADITVYAKWNTYSYTVTFNNDGGTTAANPATMIVNSPATTIDALPAPPTRTGYSFGGWYTAQNGGGSAFTASTTVSGNITVYAKWTGDTYTVTFDSDGGTTANPATKTVTRPATTIGTLPASPARSGYTFGGWNTQADGLGTPFTTLTTVNASITVFAKWDNYSYTVTFNNAGGTTAANPATMIVNSPATTIDALPAPPTRTGYIFGGWYTAQNGGGTEFTATTTVSANRTVYAKWNSYSYTVTFNNDGGTTAANPAAKTVNSPDTTVGTLPNPPTRTGYSFGGWYTAQNGGGTPFDETTTVNGNITVYAKWTANTYTVTFKSGYGTNDTLDTKTVTVPATTIGAANFPANPSRTGYNFGGWYTAQDGGGTPFTASTTVSGGITVYALWAGDYGITLDLGDAGDGAFSETNFTISKPSGSQTITITGTGYTNPRWYVDDDLKGTGASITISAADYSLGGHNLTLIITKSGVSWSKEIAFTVTN